MKRNGIHFSLYFLLLVIPSFALAQDASTGGGEAWYKIITGIIAIPAALLGLLVTLNMIKKTSLESKKLELEIKQKEEQAVDLVSSDAAVNLARPIGQGQRGLLLIIRFVILELALRLWSVVPSAVAYITSAIQTFPLLIFDYDVYEKLEPGSASGVAILLVTHLVAILLAIVYWSIIFGFGWPLFKDTCRYLNIPIKSLIEIPTLGRQRK